MTSRLIVNGDLLLYGVVGIAFFEDGFTSSEVVQALAELEGDITVRVNSPGGIATEGSAIYAALVAHQGKVTVVVEGIAASAASIIAMAGSERIMAEGALMMIHDPSGITLGTAADHLRTASALDVLAGAMARIYASRAGMSASEARQIMQDETWLDGEAAVARGFATSAGGQQAATAAVFDYRTYAKAPERLQQLSQQWAASGRRMAAFTAQRAPAPAGPQTTETTMDWKDITAETLRANRPDLMAVIDAGLEAKIVTAKADAAKGERERIAAIHAAAFPGQEALVKQLVDDGTPAGDAAMKLNADHKAKGTHVETMRAAEASVAGLGAAPNAGVTPTGGTKPVPQNADGWKAEWQASAELQEEFASADAYAAYKAGTASGRVRILSAPKNAA